MNTIERSPGILRDQAAISGMEYAPGTNQHGELASVDWRFLLPTPQFEAVLFIGPPRSAALAAIARTASVVVVASTDLQVLREVARSSQTRSLTNVYPVRVSTFGDLPFRKGRFDLIVATPGRGLAPFLASRDSAAGVARALTPGGTIYLETSTRADALRASRLSKQLTLSGFRAPRHFWLARRKGEIHIALPLSDMDRARYFFDQVLYGISRKARLLRHVGRYASRFRLLRLAVPGRATILQRTGSENVPDGPAGYLTTLAERAGIDLSAHRPVFFARGGYDSNKVAFFCFDRSTCTPEILVKMTRAPRFNSRLEAEHRALSLVKEKHFADPGTYPDALFLDHHYGLAVLGEKVVRGTPFRTRTTAEANCPFARDAIEWITRLGATSADRTATTAQEVSDRLMRLFMSFAEIYPLSDSEGRFLEDRIVAVGSATGSIPAVFRHGDAGTWNVLAGDDGRAIFLDWEVSEPQGLPLWDLFDFVRSFGSWVGRVRGERNSVRSYAANFLQDTSLSRLQAEATERYCESVGLDRHFVEPLFYTCWMQRAVREAAWMSAPREQGSYFSLLRLCIGRRETGGSSWLYA